MRAIRIFFAACAVAAVAACATLNFNAQKATEPFPAYPAASFAVFSDPHIFLPELGIGQPSFEKIKYDDRKIFEHSQSLLDAVIAKIIEAKPQFVIVPGDLSKDGEEAVHLAFAAAMEKIRAQGIPVFVIPGNHDVNNPLAFRYEGDTTVRIPNVTPERFAEIYNDFGYSQAIDRDPASLAYVVEPIPGMWLLALDACRYDLSAKEPHEHTGGSFLPARLDWIKKVLDRARAENKSVIAMMHHGVVEHFDGQKKQFGEYVVDDNVAFSRLLAQYGVRVVFTGHFHAQNIAGAWWDAQDRPSVEPPTDGAAASSNPQFIYDVETGSLVTYPCPYRLVQIDQNQIMHIRSYRIDSLPEMPTGFQQYALDYSKKGMIPYIVDTLGGLGVSKDEALRIAEPLTEAGIAHYAGDPHFQGTEMYPTTNLSFMGWLAIQMKKDVIVGMWTGKPPHADNNIDINLADGTYAKVE